MSGDQESCCIGKGGWIQWVLDAYVGTMCALAFAVSHGWRLIVVALLAVLVGRSVGNIKRRVNVEIE